MLSVYIDFLEVEMTDMIVSQQFLDAGIGEIESIFTFPRPMHGGCTHSRAFVFMKAWSNTEIAQRIQGKLHSFQHFKFYYDVPGQKCWKLQKNTQSLDRIVYMKRVASIGNGSIPSIYDLKAFPSLVSNASSRQNEKDDDHENIAKEKGTEEEEKEKEFEEQQQQQKEKEKGLKKDQHDDLSQPSPVVEAPNEHTKVEVVIAVDALKQMHLDMKAFVQQEIKTAFTNTHNNESDKFVDLEMNAANAEGDSFAAPYYADPSLNPMNYYYHPPPMQPHQHFQHSGSLSTPFPHYYNPYLYHPSAYGYHVAPFPPPPPAQQQQQAPYWYHAGPYPIPPHPPQHTPIQSSSSSSSSLSTSSSVDLLRKPCLRPEGW